MKHTHFRKFMTAAALFLSCVMITGISVTYALFSDRDSKEGITANMATVDIELQSLSFVQNSGTASFEIENNSNINIYLRAGIIFELTTESGEPVIADTSGITVTTSGQGWKAEQKTLNDGNNEYIKWFLGYGNGTSYTAVNPDTNPSAAFSVTGIPDGCRLIVNVVPEAVQADVDDDALEYFKDSQNINPAW